MWLVIFSYFLSKKTIENKNKFHFDEMTEKDITIFNMNQDIPEMIILDKLNLKFTAKST